MNRVPIGIPLTGVDVVNNAVTIALRSYLTPIDGYCLDPTNPPRLTDVAIRYEGSELPPATVADFLPPVLRKLTLFIPATPNQVESNAAIRLAATAVAARYGTQNPDVVLMPLVDGSDRPERAFGTDGTADRHPRVAGGRPTRIARHRRRSLAARSSGPPNELVNQARLLSSNVAQLAVSSNAVVGPLSTTPQLPADVTTIRALGRPRGQCAPR